MTLTNDQIQKLMQLVADATPDQLDCGGCLDQLAEFAETELAGKSIREALECVKVHLRNCPCCQDEYETLLAALSEADRE